MPYFPTGITPYFSSFASSSSYRKSVSTTTLSPSGTSSSLEVTMWFLCLIFGFICFILGNLFASIQASAPILLTLLPGQFILCFQRNSICILYFPDCHHIYFILDIISWAINVSGNFLFVSLSLCPALMFNLENSYVYSFKINPLCLKFYILLK